MRGVSQRIQCNNKLIQFYKKMTPKTTILIAFTLTFQSFVIGKPLEFNNSTISDMVLLKIPIRSLRHPRQDPGVNQTTPIMPTNQNNQSSSTNPSPMYPNQPTPGTAVNVGQILTGLFSEDVRPILTGSTAFIPPGNLRESVEQLLFGFAPFFQNLLFGPNSVIPFQTFYPMAQYGKQTTVQPAESTMEETTLKSEEEREISSSTTIKPTTITTLNPTPNNRSSQLQIKGEAEGSGVVKEKEYIYLVLKPDEFEELVKHSNLSSKNRIVSNQKPEDIQTFLSSNKTPTPKPSHIHSPLDNEDDEYEAFLLNNVTNLHLRDFYFNWTRI